MTFRIVGDKARYEFHDERCIGRFCWAPGSFQHRGASGAGMGTHATGHYSDCCMTRAYRGCPEGPEGEKQEQDSTYGLVTVSGLPIFDPRVAAEHKKLGWKKG